MSGSTAQVQGQSSQVAVTWTDGTTFTRQVDGEAKDVKVGSCVMVSSADQTSTDTSKVTAATVRVTEAVDGSCTSGMGGGPGGGGQPPSGGEAPSGERPTDLPTDMPTDAPGGAEGGRGQRGGFAVGEVTAVSDTGFTVSSELPGGTEDAATAITVVTSSATTYTTTESAAASDVKVGVCVTSRGEADDTGAITATTIAVSAAVDGECATGFGGGRPGAGA
ncbi:hypothetical protein [Aeromicrobium sp. UC242_57]|uniref:hypothetical protein n=1 Tax=Aeromicrobium sp. UC242_57 TaxID=3374624 RepID=UPI003796BD07